MISEEIIIKALLSLNIEPLCQDINKMLFFLDLLTEHNKKTNVTGTKNREDILKRHFFDCLAGYQYFFDYSGSHGQRTSILDVGTGGGLPGLLIAIFLKGATVNLMDAKKKNMDFLTETVEALNLENVNVMYGRAEELSHSNDYREKFDVVTARAVADMLLLSELVLPFCKVGGKAILYKSKKVFDELKKSENKIKMLGGEIENIYEIKVPLLDEFRVVLVLKKVSATLYKYPRKYVRMLKEPLIGQKDL